jgi:penicillin-binding protein 1A
VFGFGSRGKSGDVRRSLLAIDSWLDDTFWKLTPAATRKWDAVCAAFDRFRVRGWRRFASEALGEGLTLGAAGAVLVTALATPAFREPATTG